MQFKCMDPWAFGFQNMAQRVLPVINIIVHRIEVSQEDVAYGDSPSEIIRFFNEHPVGHQATGGMMPYPLIIEADATVTQTLPLNTITPHAVRYNPTAIGIGCVGDFRTHTMPQPQWHALVQTCAVLLQYIECHPDSILAHDTLEGGTRVADKECPGAQVSIEKLRRCVSAVAPDKCVAQSLVWH